MPFKIFVSYSTKDIGHVEFLKEQLDGSPVSVFIAEHSVKPSEELAPKIANAIAECDLFVLLWSANAKSSEWVSQEIGRASALNKSILPLNLSVDLPLPGFLSGLKFFPIYEDPETALPKAREIILDEYRRWQEASSKLQQQKDQKERDQLAMMALGAFLLWTISK